MRSLLKLRKSCIFLRMQPKKRIDRIEQRIGTPLFLRSPKGMILTPAGKSFYIDCKRLEEEMSLAAERARNIGAQEAA